MPSDLHNADLGPGASAPSDDCLFDHLNRLLDRANQSRRFRLAALAGVLAAAWSIYSSFSDRWTDGSHAEILGLVISSTFLFIVVAGVMARLFDERGRILAPRGSFEDRENYYRYLETFGMPVNARLFHLAFVAPFVLTTLVVVVTPGAQGLAFLTVFFVAVARNVVAASLPGRLVARISRSTISKFVAEALNEDPDRASEDYVWVADAYRLRRVSSDPARYRGSWTSRAILSVPALASVAALLVLSFSQGGCPCALEPNPKLSFTETMFLVTTIVLLLAAAYLALQTLTARFSDFVAEAIEDLAIGDGSPNEAVRSVRLAARLNMWHLTPHVGPKRLLEMHTASKWAKKTSNNDQQADDDSRQPHDMATTEEGPGEDLSAA